MDGSSGPVAHTLPLCASVIVLTLNKQESLVTVTASELIKWQLHFELLPLVHKGVGHHFPCYHVGISVPALL